jgi:hypothetical protein
MRWNAAKLAVAFAGAFSLSLPTIGSRGAVNGQVTTVLGEPIGRAQVLFHFDPAGQEKPLPRPDSQSLSTEIQTTHWSGESSATERETARWPRLGGFPTRPPRPGGNQATNALPPPRGGRGVGGKATGGLFGIGPSITFGTTRTRISADRLLTPSTGRLGARLVLNQRSRPCCSGHRSRSERRTTGNDGSLSPRPGVERGDVIPLPAAPPVSVTTR